MAINLEKIKQYNQTPQQRGSINFAKIQSYGQEPEVDAQPLDVSGALESVKQRRTQETTVRLPFSERRAELGGGAPTRFAANVVLRAFEDIYVGGAKVLATAKGRTVTSPFAVTNEPTLTGEAPVTQTKFEPMSRAALSRIKQLDQERPEKRTLNLLQGTAEEVFLPVLNAVDIVGLSSLATRLARKATFSKEASSALKTMNIGLLDDTSEVGIRRHFQTEVQKNIDNLAKEKVTKKEFVKRMDDIGGAIDTLSDGSKTRFGTIGQRINNVATALEMERKIGRRAAQKDEESFGMSLVTARNATREAERTALSVKGVANDVNRVDIDVEPPQELLRVDDLITERDILKETLDNNPAKELQKFYAKGNNSLAQIQKQNELSGRKSAKLDDIVTELGFRDLDDADEALQAYRADKERLVELNDSIKEAKQVASESEYVQRFSDIAKQKVQQAADAKKTFISTAQSKVKNAAIDKKGTPKVSKLAKRINEDLPESNKISEFYDVKTIKGELDKAAKAIEKDKDKALASAVNDGDALTQRAAKLMEFAEAAKNSGDVQTQSALLAKMRALGTDIAQGLNMFKAYGFSNPESNFMSDVVDARLSKISISADDISRAGSIQKAQAEKVYAPVKKELTKRTREAFKIEDAQALFNDIMC